MLFLHKKIAHIDGHISAFSESHILELKTSELLLATSNMNNVHFDSTQISYYFQLLKIPNSHKIIGQTETQLP